MPVRLLTLFALTSLSCLAQTVPETRFFPVGSWPLCAASAVTASLPCFPYKEGTEPALLQIRAVADSRAVAFMYAVVCTDIYGKPHQFTGAVLRQDDSYGWTSVVIPSGCTAADTSAAELISETVASVVGAARVHPRSM